MNKFSIILPVKNGGDYIKECISSILEQRYTDFELLILENKSSDNTIDSINAFADERIKVIPSNADLTIEQNWARIVEITKAEYITLIGHDDVLDKNYLSEINDLITKYPESGLYQTHFRYIDKSGKELKKCVPMGAYFTPEKVVEGFLENKISLMGTGFIMRSKNYDMTGGIPPYPNLLFADMEIFIEMAIKGGLTVSSKELFSYRIHQVATTSSSSDENFFKAFERLVHYLMRLKAKEPF